MLAPLEVKVSFNVALLFGIVVPVKVVDPNTIPIVVAVSMKVTFPVCVAVTVSDVLSFNVVDLRSVIASVPIANDNGVSVHHFLL